MASQVAKLFIRGRLVNETAKNLTEEQKIKAMELMEKAWNDPNLQNPKYEFCMALARTIGNEYKNLDYGMQEIWITFWRAAVDALYHNPKPKVVEDAKIRKKHFQTWMFNYLRQILLENKIPRTYIKKELDGPANLVAKDYIKLLLDNNLKVHYTIDDVQDSITFNVNTTVIPVDVLEKVWGLRDEVEPYDVVVKTSDDKIEILYTGIPQNYTKEINERIRINAVSISGMDQDDSSGFQQHCEYQGVRQREAEVDHMMTQDAISTLKERLPEQAQEILSMLLEPTDEFLKEYYPNRKKTVVPKECHLAKWFGMSKPEVQKIMKQIRQQAKALDLG